MAAEYSVVPFIVKSGLLHGHPGVIVTDTVVKQAFRASLELHYMVKIAFTIILSKYLNIMTCPILILII